jgi:hypothetical protein
LKDIKRKTALFIQYILVILFIVFSIIYVVNFKYIEENYKKEINNNFYIYYYFPIIKNKK